MGQNDRDAGEILEKYLRLPNSAEVSSTDCHHNALE